MTWSALMALPLLSLTVTPGWYTTSLRYGVGVAPGPLTSSASRTLAAPCAAITPALGFCGSALTAPLSTNPRAMLPALTVVTDGRPELAGSGFTHDAVNVSLPLPENEQLICWPLCSAR